MTSIRKAYELFKFSYSINQARVFAFFIESFQYVYDARFILKANKRIARN